MRRTVAVVLISLSAAACTEEVHEVTLSSALAPCMMPWESLCLRAAAAGAEAPTFIEGFTFRWGTEATVRYRVEDVDDPPADGSSKRYILEAVLATREEAAGTVFTSQYPPAEPDGIWFAADQPGIVAYLGTPVACEAAICEQLIAPQVTGTRRAVTFEHTGGLIPLRATAVQPVP